MEINTIKVDSYPSSEKVYLDGALFPIKVGMRKIILTPNVRYEGGTRIETPNDPVLVYDTSGPYTDPAQKIDINQGIPRLREQWIADRDDTEQLDDITSQYGRMRRDDHQLDAIRFPIQHKPLKAKPGKRITQMAYAKAGIITPEMG